MEFAVHPAGYVNYSDHMLCSKNINVEFAKKKSL